MVLEGFFQEYNILMLMLDRAIQNHQTGLFPPVTATIYRRIHQRVVTIFLEFLYEILCQAIQICLLRDTLVPPGCLSRPATQTILFIISC